MQFAIPCNQFPSYPPPLPPLNSICGSILARVSDLALLIDTPVICQRKRAIRDALIHAYIRMISLSYDIASLTTLYLTYSSYPPARNSSTNQPTGCCKSLQRPAQATIELVASMQAKTAQHRQF